MASADIINFENKYDYPDNCESQQHRRSSVAAEWYKKCITTASSTVLLGITTVVVVVVMLVLNAGPKDLVVQLTIHPVVLKTILI